jgi:hypothetical protein
MAICTRCGKKITERSGWRVTKKGYHHESCPVGASESEAAQRFASSCGSASAASNTGVFPSRKLSSEIIEALKPKAEDEPHDLSRAVQLPVSDLVALCEEWRAFSKLDKFTAARNKSELHPVTAGYFFGRAEAFDKSADELERLIASQRPQRSGGERRKLNAELCNRHGKT